ncbi:response regulator transcription factor [Pseudonocardia endophytica]|uniref:DNA-binding response OmpR family regulator n=1 Tax=Pseudonocardia endophytica TaxID=401976 RepID=A0A4R1HNW8_PSEEN|nr:response regulator transcription factor [Pseudonocardia endophytica]TCK22080.1 DNA-binding response OmpR family regulator [Pseudonocardia endophytica]
MARVLVAEVESVEAIALTDSFRRRGFDASRVVTGTEAVREAARVDLVVLGVEPVDLSSREVCALIRRRCAVPIIGVVVRHTSLDRRAALEAGMDAYLPAGYCIGELLARAEVSLRRFPPVAGDAGSIVCGPLVLTPESREVFLHGRSLTLTRKEFDLLRLLADDPSRVVSRREIMAEVWADDYGLANRTIDTHVSSLRQKLGYQRAILNIRGVGFRIGWWDDDSSNPAEPVGDQFSTVDLQTR